MLTLLNLRRMKKPIFTYLMIPLFLIINLQLQTNAEKIMEDRKSLTEEQEKFLREIAEFDDALWEKETKTLFARYSESLAKLNPSSSVVGGVSKVSKSPQSSVIVFSLPESAVYTPDGINLTLILETLNKNKNRHPSAEQTSLPVPVIASVAETSVDDEETERTILAPPTTTPVTPVPPQPARQAFPIQTPTVAPAAAVDSFTAATTLRSDILRNSTEIATTLGNTTESGARNDTKSTTENHILKQVQKIINASAQRNISGILDASLGITGNTDLTNFVNGIFKISYCNAIRTLLGLC